VPEPAIRCRSPGRRRACAPGLPRS
jgi:hypothetical protein